MIRLPFGPLENAVVNKINRVPSQEELAIILGIATQEMVARYRVKGLTVWTADVLAVHINLHPVEIWGLEAWFAGISDEELDRDPDFPMPRLLEP